MMRIMLKLKQRCTAEALEHLIPPPPGYWFTFSSHRSEGLIYALLFVQDGGVVIQKSFFFNNNKETVNIHIK